MIHLFRAAKKGKRGHCVRGKEPPFGRCEQRLYPLESWNRGRTAPNCTPEARSDTNLFTADLFSVNIAGQFASHELQRFRSAGLRLANEDSASYLYSVGVICDSFGAILGCT